MAHRVLRPSAADLARPHPGRRLRFDSAAVTHTGAVREHNEDFAYAGELLVAVADGVGGNAYGEVASELAIGAIAYLEDEVFVGEPDAEVGEAARRANLRLDDAVAQDGALAGMATTLTALRLVGDSLVVAQVGDSRAYLMRTGELEQITHDDSLVQQLVDAGVITPAQARRHPARSLVLQALGSGPVHPTVNVRDVAVGDRYLVCSDGLSDYVEDGAIAAALRNLPDRDACCAALVAAALAVGAPDNVTCVVADVAPAVAA